MKTVNKTKLKIIPLDKNHWKDFELLFGNKGACGGCWCMFWRLRGSEFNRNKGEGNKKEIHKLVNKNEILGLLAYIDNQLIGWCAISPRGKYIRLESSKILEPVDTQSVWSIPCFYIAKNYRRKGITVELLKNAIHYCKKNGAKIIEGYPLDANNKKIVDVFAYTGLFSAFQKAGFKEILRRSPTRPIMRYIIK